MRILDKILNVFLWTVGIIAAFIGALLVVLLAMTPLLMYVAITAAIIFGIYFGWQYMEAMP